MKKILIPLLTILFTISAMAQSSANLKLNLEKNKVYRLKNHSEQTVNQTVNGIQQTVETKVDYSISLKMIDATPNFIIAEVHFDTLITNTNSMGKIVSISSAVEGNMKSSEIGDIISCIMHRLSRNTVYAKLDFTGKPVEIVNGKMLSELIIKDTSDITLAGTTASTVKKQIISTISEENLKTMIGMFTWRLPAKEVSVGEDWKMTQQTNSGGMKLDIMTTNHLEKISGNDAVISAESKIRAADNAAPLLSGGATITYDNLQGVSKSNLVIDITTGLALADKSETHISGTLGISGPGFNMQMPMDIRGESSVSTLK